MSLQSYVVRLGGTLTVGNDGENNSKHKVKKKQTHRCGDSVNQVWLSCEV